MRLAVALLAAAVLGDTLRPGVAVKDEGTAKGQAATVNCVGTAATCSVGAGGVWTLDISGGSSGLPADPAACPANQYVTDQSQTGVLVCAQVGYGQLTGAPTIPADVSAAPFVTTVASGLLSAESVLPTCAGTTKLTFNGSAISCATDQDTVYTLPAASTTLGGVKMAAACSAGNHVASIGAGGELGCTADSGGALAAATATVLGGLKGNGTTTACSGTDKMTGWDAAGALTCATDQTGGAGSVDLRGFVTAFGGF